jgi:hypothetical protein
MIDGRKYKYKGFTISIRYLFHSIPKNIRRRPQTDEMRNIPENIRTVKNHKPFNNIYSNYKDELNLNTGITNTELYTKIYLIKITGRWIYISKKNTIGFFTTTRH